jgi:hypothetical protein
MKQEKQQKFPFQVSLEGTFPLLSNEKGYLFTTPSNSRIMTRMLIFLADHFASLQQRIVPQRPLLQISTG